jgi:hypothetical protein
VKGLGPWAFWIFVVFFVVTQPAGAASFVHTAFGWLGAIGNGFSDFVSDTAGTA